MEIKDIAYWDVESFDAGMIERTRRARGCLTVWEGALARNVIAAVQAVEPSVVVCVAGNDTVTGLFVPRDFLARVQRHLYRDARNLPEAIDRLENDHREVERHFHHAFLNHQRPDLVWCPAGQHLTSDPCPDHRAPSPVRSVPEGAAPRGRRGVTRS